MLRERNTSQLGLQVVPPLEQMVPADHPLRRLDKVLDLHFVYERVRHLYCPDNGRPAIDPVVIIRLFVLQAFTGIPHVRQLLREVQVNLAYRWFIGYELTEALPDHSTLSRALDRFGDGVFNELFQASIAQCQRSGLVEGRLLHVDATTIRADLDKDRAKQPNPPDPDAHYGRFPGNRKEPGYKQHTVADDQSRVILGVAVTPANVHEGGQFNGVVAQAIAQLDGPPMAVCADSAYANGENAKICEQQGGQLISPPPKPRNGLSGEQFTIERFIYDEERDEFICPNGKILHNAGPQVGRKDRFKYRASARDCRVCPLKGQCTRSRQRWLHVGKHHGALVRLRQRSRTAQFKAWYRRRSPVIEGLFAEGKQWHGLGRAWRRGLGKMRVQCLLISAVLNFKRAAGLVRLRPAVARAVLADFLALSAVWSPHQTLRELLRAILTPFSIRIRLHRVHYSLLGTVQ